MQISHDAINDTLIEQDLYERLLPLDGARIVELGCGAGLHTRNVAAGGANREVIAYEVDTVQHEKNCLSDKTPNVNFKYGGAQEIDEVDGSVDVVMLFKSLHHVPIDEMPAALKEIKRVLKPGGLAYISEPIFAGEFNEVLRLFHDEQHVRQCAFDAVQKSVNDGVLELVDQVFFHSPVHFTDFEELDTKIIQATHSEHRLDTSTYKLVKEAFEKHLTAQGADFLMPMRVDVLKKSP